MREVTEHKSGFGMDNELSIVVVDQPGVGGASHEYEIISRDLEGLDVIQRIKFQKGPVKETGINGISHEALLAIVVDRLRSFQGGSFPCRENAEALVAIELALSWLHHRTKERNARLVEGTSKA